MAKSPAALSHLQTYDLLATEGTLHLEDVRLFQHVLKSKWPNTFLQLDTSIKLFYNLIAVLFTTEHPLFLTMWDRMRGPMSEYFSVDPAKPAQYLRSLQFSTSVYWETFATLDHNLALLHSAPNLMELIQSVRTQTWVAPSLPGFTPRHFTIVRNSHIGQYYTTHSRHHGIRQTCTYSTNPSSSNKPRPSLHYY